MMPSSTHSNLYRAWGGFTLIEMLAVIVIPSLVAAVGAVGLVNSDAQAKLHAAAAQWQEMDSFARTFSSNHGPVSMNLNDSCTVVGLESLGGERMTQVAVPDGLLGQLHIDEQLVSEVHYSAQGRCDDYVVTIRESQSHRIVMMWSVCGLSGWIVEEGSL